MKTIVVLCLLALTFAAPATKKRDIQRVFAQVESALATNGPLDIVANVLGEFTNDATAEQSAFDELRARATRECALESEYRTRQVNEAESARKSAQTALDSYIDQKNRAVADLSFTNKVLGETETMIHILTESRAAEVTSFAEYEETYNFNAAQFDEVVELVEAVVSGQASFVQIAKHAQKMLRSAVKSNQGEKIATLMSMLVQVTAGETDNEFLEQLSNVVNRLRGEIDDEWNTVQAQEQKDQEEFETFSAAAEAQHATLTATRDYLEGLLAQLNRGIVEETGAVNASTARRDQHQRLLDEATAYCNTNEQLYQTGTQERRDELDLIDNLRAKVTLRWGDFEDIERERVQRERAAGKRF